MYFPYVFSALSSRGLERGAGHEYFGLDSSLTCCAHTPPHSHASRVAASEPVPENGLPGCQHKTKLLKYLNIRSLLRLPCNYTCSFHIPLDMGVCLPAWTWIDFFGVCVCISKYLFTHSSVLSYTQYECVCAAVGVCSHVLCVFLWLCVCSQLLFLGHGPGTPSFVPPSLQLGSIQIMWKLHYALCWAYCSQNSQREQWPSSLLYGSCCACCYITSFYRSL